MHLDNEGKTEMTTLCSTYFSHNKQQCIWKTNLGRFHVHDFSDSALHDQKVRVVDVELNGAEQILHALVCGVDAVDQVLVPATDHHLWQSNKEVHNKSHTPVMLLKVLQKLAQETIFSAYNRDHVCSYHRVAHSLQFEGAGENLKIDSYMDISP